MGIRWYGWEITPDEALAAEHDPWPVIRMADGRHDDPDWGVIDLDKAWTGLQRLFSDPRHGGVFRPRPAYRLVAGDVSYPEGPWRGYLPHTATIDVATVREVARDLGTVTDADIRVYGDAWAPLSYVAELRHFVPIAREFTADAASRGHCILYVIR